MAPNTLNSDTPHQSRSTYDLIQRALAEDEISNDITTSFLATDVTVEAILIAKAPGVLAGVQVALEVFKLIDKAQEATVLIEDGNFIHPGSCIATLHGNLGCILQAERTALNFIQRLSGVATATQAYVQAISDFPSKIVDTRKTIPGWRELDKYAVRMGGGINHRLSLADGILIKDNHIAGMLFNGEGIKELVKRIRSGTTQDTIIEIEVEDHNQANEALTAGADVLMLDNMNLSDMRKVVKLARGRARTEASGGITLKTVRAVAETGVDFISTGSITHSTMALDISLEIKPRIH